MEPRYDSGTAMTGVTIEFEWQEVGPITLDGEGKLDSPGLSTGPGVYRMVLDDDGARFAYVGETDGLQRRTQHYRTPGQSQKTNIRMNGLLVEHLSRGGSARLFVATGSRAALDGSAVVLDLNQKAHRMAVESCALLAELVHGINASLNL